MDNMKEKEIRLAISDICKKALEGHIELDEFYSIWPGSVFNVPFYEQLYEDLEEGIEHLPGFFFKKGIDYKAWTDSANYLRIYLDLILLSFDKDINELIMCREYILKQEELSEEIIKKGVAVFFER